jgi:hypothetical protein
MPLEAPNLDNRTYDGMLDESAGGSSSTVRLDRSEPNDPGSVLLEAFTFLTDRWSTASTGSRRRPTSSS